MGKKIGTSRKIGRKIVVMLIAFTMLFSVALFSGCTNDNSDVLNELAQLRELLEEKSGLSQQLQELTELVNGMKEDNAGLAGKIEALQGSIDALTKRLGGLEASNGYLLGMIEDLQEQLEELRQKLREWGRLQGDFVLSISVENTTLRQGQNTEITAIFKNQSNTAGIIGFGGSIVNIYVSKWYDDISTGVASFMTIEENTMLSYTFQRGSRLPLGKHALIAVASFYFPLASMFPIFPEDLFIEIQSNSIILTVIE